MPTKTLEKNREYVARHRSKVRNLIGNDEYKKKEAERKRAYRASKKKESLTLPPLKQLDINKLVNIPSLKSLDIYDLIKNKKIPKRFSNEEDWKKYNRERIAEWRKKKRQ